MPVRLNGSTSGYTEIASPAVGVNNTVTLPTTTNGSLVALDANGRLGIGTASPNEKLEVAGGIRASGALLTGSANSIAIDYITDARIISYGANTSTLGAFAFLGSNSTASASTERMRIDAIGRLGIGTASPSQNLHVSSGGDTIIKVDSSTGAYTTRLSLSSGGVGSAVVENTSAGPLVFAINSSERMRITSTGLVGINTTSKLDGNNVSLAVKGNLPATPIEVQQDTTSQHYALTFRNANGLVGNITTNGSATAFNTSSDYRLKENVVPLNGAIDRINDLQVCRFNFIADPDHTVDGFIAHEAQAVVPECVTGEKDAVDDDGNPVYQGIDQSKLVPLLTAALQEAIGELQVLKAKVAALEAK